MSAPCTEPTCACFARPGYATCVFHDPAAMKLRAAEQDRRVAAGVAAVRRYAAALLEIDPKRAATFHARVRSLERAIAWYRKAVE